MPITISDTSIVVDGSKSTWSVPSPFIFMGEIVRLFNSSSTTQTYDYTGIDGITTTATVAATTSSYILVKSGSATDSWNGTTKISSIKLFITASELGNPFSEQRITTTGAGTWTKPLGVTQVVVECWGGGGAGGGATPNNGAGGGGASGMYVRKYLQYSSPSQNISYNVGTGGTAGTGNGTDGGDTTWNTSDVISKGGGGGTGSIVSEFTPLGEGIAPNSSSGVGDIIYVGENGEGGYYDPVGAAGQPGTYGGRGGDNPGSTNNNYDFDITTFVEFGGAGAISIFAGTQGINGDIGGLYGGGGGGAAKVSGANRSGGAGAQGLIRILYR